MKHLPLSILSTLVLALATLGPTAVWAQGPSHTDHIMVVPADLKWADVPLLAAGAKIALIEGPLNEAVPSTFRLKFPANYKLPGLLASCDRACDGDIGHLQHGDGRQA